MFSTLQPQPPARLWCPPVWCPAFCSTGTARQVLTVCSVVPPLGAKIHLCSPSVHRCYRRLINRMSFHACFLECNSRFMSRSHPSKTTGSHLRITKPSRPCAPQGVSVSVLCRDVVWLTEEVLFRNKDVGFGGSVTQVVHYALSLLAPHLLIAAAPTRLVFSENMKAPLYCW